MRQTDTAILLPDLNGALRETTRIERTERIDPSVVRDESTQLVRDVNGRWLATERRSDVIRQTGPSERLEEQTIEHLDVNGKVMIVEVHRMTTKTDGRSTLEEVEGPSLVSPGDPARVIRRTVTTVRPNGADRSITEREVFELDVNGRMTRVARETVESSGR